MKGRVLTEYCFRRLPKWTRFRRESLWRGMKAVPAAIWLCTSAAADGAKPSVETQQNNAIPNAIQDLPMPSTSLKTLAAPITSLRLCDYALNRESHFLCPSYWPVCPGSNSFLVEQKLCQSNRRQEAQVISANFIILERSLVRVIQNYNLINLGQSLKMYSPQREMYAIKSSNIFSSQLACGT